MNPRHVRIAASLRRKTGFVGVALWEGKDQRRYLGTFPRDATARVLCDQGAWLQLKIDEIIGWTLASNVEDCAPPTPDLEWYF